MMKNIQHIVFLFLIGYTFNFYGQKGEIHNIYATDNKTFVMFFPSPIERAIDGASHFKFGYNKSIEDFIGILKASKGPDSNLTVITVDGNIYSFNLKYSSTIKTTNFFVKEESAIGNINNNMTAIAEKRKDSLTKIKLAKKEEIKEKIYKKKSEIFIENAKSIMGSEPYYVRNFRYNAKVKLQVKNVFYVDDQFYLLMEINNKSNIDYDINFLEFYVTSKKTGKSKSAQKIIIDPLFNYNYKKIVEKGTINEFVFVFPKISINNKKIFVVDLNEKKGEKNISVPLDYKTLNNPQKF